MVIRAPVRAWWQLAVATLVGIALKAHVLLASFVGQKQLLKRTLLIVQLVSIL